MIKTLDSYVRWCAAIRRAGIKSVLKILCVFELRGKVVSMDFFSVNKDIFHGSRLPDELYRAVGYAVNHRLCPSYYP